MKNTFKSILIILLFPILLSPGMSFSQSLYTNKFTEWTTWTLLQTIPSPTFYQDRNDSDSRLQFGFRWHIT
ncbi:MAG: hypothetical protein KDD00_10070, partial [Ignavibacteriae bacterium]|nr:hypothetical protein [Ignavibacteriota bacterium]